jgi:tetratricopeptide (TPR) repeat protein
MRMPQEGKAVLTKAIADKTVNADDRTNRLLKLATDRAAQAAAGAAKALADAQAAPQGDALVQIGGDQVGQGKAKEAIATIQAGIAKKPADMAYAQTRLGAAYLAAGQKAEAIRAFNAVKGDDKLMMVAHLYELVARR